MDEAECRTLNQLLGIAIDGSLKKIAKKCDSALGAHSVLERLIV